MKESRDLPLNVMLRKDTQEVGGTGIGKEGRRQIEVPNQDPSSRRSAICEQIVQKNGAI